MSRIRSIKPEFPHSESIGKLSRDARLLFIMLWTFVDDAGRCRAASRMLASLLYPYDDDAKRLMDSWLGDLELHGHVVIYDVNGSRYLEICNWLKHQKIDHPSTSRLPAPSDGLASPREDSRTLATDLGPRTLDQDLGPRTKKTGKTLLPDSWLPSSAHIELGGKVGLAREAVDDGAAEMRSWSLGNGEKRRDWDRVFDNWLRRKAKESGNGHRGHRTFQDDSKSASRAAGRLAEAAERGEYTFGPRPSLLPQPEPPVVRLLPKG